MDEQLDILPYKKLASMLKSDSDSRRAVAQEIRKRRREGSIPEIKATKHYELSENQGHIYKAIVTALTGDPEVKETDKIKVHTVSYKVKGGWVVYVTGTDQERIIGKIQLIKQMVNDDAEEFGLCRVCLAAVRRKEWDGLLVRFDRGLRLVYE